MLLYRISPVSIKRVLKSVTNSIYTYPIDIQIHFPSTKENFQSNIFTFNFYFCTTIYASQTIFPKKEEGKRGGGKKKEKQQNSPAIPIFYDRFPLSINFPLTISTIVHTDHPANSKCTVISLSCTMAEEKSNKSRPNICSTWYRLTAGYSRGKTKEIFLSQK